MTGSLVGGTRARAGWAFFLALGATAACKTEHANEAAGVPASAPRPPAMVSSTSTSASAPPPGPPTPEDEFDTALRRWNDATNLGDGAALAALYAENLALYGHSLPRARAVESKVHARKKDPGFAQWIDHVRWEKRRDDGEATFDKKFRSGNGEHTVRAYLTLRKIDGSVRIVAEGDRETDRTIAAKRKAVESSWGERFFDCPDCAAESDPAQAFPPLGPPRLTPGGKAPPGAPDVVEYARLYLDRFASAVDLPTFVVVTPHSGNGDGRWFYFPPAKGPDGPKLLDCAAGGFWMSPDEKQPGSPDPGHASHPEITSTEAVTRDHDGVHYEKHLYSPERVENFLTCTLDPQYEAYFLAILRRSGRSLRAIAGGQADRPERTSDPF